MFPGLGDTTFPVNVVRGKLPVAFCSVQRYKPSDYGESYLLNLFSPSLKLIFVVSSEGGYSVYAVVCLGYSKYSSISDFCNRSKVRANKNPFGRDFLPNRGM